MAPSSTEQKQNTAKIQRRIRTLQQVVERRPLTMRWVLTMITAAVMIIAVQLFLYFTTKIEGTLVVAGSVGVALVLIIIAYGFVRRRQNAIAGYLMLTAILVAYIGAELALKQLTAYFAFGGITLIWLLGKAFLPRRRSVWLVAIILYCIALAVVNVWEPLPRHDAFQLSSLGVQIAVVTLLLGVLF
ncbi:MAG TPA: hypothetical protein ENF52_06030, partial [Chloroflexi bacterium]|nr:hypothetical protein [Chloroflexota bacterium]